MCIRDRRKSGNHNPDFRISRPKRIDQFNVIFHKEITIIGDVYKRQGYSCLTMIDRETIGILYESSAAHMTFQALKLKDLIR